MSWKDLLAPEGGEERTLPWAGGRGDQDYHLWLKNPYYRRVSSGIPAAIQEQNERLVNTLDRIPRSPHRNKRSR
jgi:hypothetical protein